MVHCFVFFPSIRCSSQYISYCIGRYFWLRLPVTLLPSWQNLASYVFYNVADDGRLKPDVGDSPTSLPTSSWVLSDMTRFTFPILTVAIAGHQGCERCSARACSTSCREQSRRSDGGSTGEGSRGRRSPFHRDWGPSSGIDRRSDFFFFFPSRVRWAFCDIGLVLYQHAPQEKRLRLRIREGKIRGDFTACGYPPP